MIAFLRTLQAAFQSVRRLASVLDGLESQVSRLARTIDEVDRRLSSIETKLEVGRLRSALASPPKELKWLVSADGTRCADGYPIQIRRVVDGGIAYELTADGRKPFRSRDLGRTELEARRIATEMDAFEPR